MNRAHQPGPWPFAPGTPSIARTDAPAFPDNLDVSVTLTVGATTVAVPAGSVRHVGVRARPWGFEARVRFVVSSEEVTDPLFADFSGRTRIDAKLRIVPRPIEDPENTTDRSLSFTGVVIDREVHELVAPDVTGAPLYERHYEIRFVDPLAALWTEHRPLELRVAASFAELLDAHKPPGVTLTLKSSRLDEKQDVLFVPLSGERRASFYDFVVERLREVNATLEHAPKAGTYRMAQRKKRFDDAVLLTAEEVDRIRIEAPEPRRSTLHVVNPAAEGHADTAVTNADAVTGARRDVLHRVMVPALLEKRVAVAKDREKPPSHAIVVHLRRFPDELPSPGAGIAFEDEVGDKRFTAKKRYRVTELDLEVDGPLVEEGTSVDLEDPSARFDIRLVVRAEHEEDTRPRLPPFLPTRAQTRVHVEARVLSASGAPEDRTWMAAENAAIGLSELTCEIPLWNKIVPLPFTPGKEPGHFYFPPYKGQRVLVELTRDAARLHRFLDWAPNARTPMDAQGDRLVMGYQEGNGTTLDHAYVDAKPELKLHRTMGGDKQKIELRPLTILFDVREEEVAQEVTPRFDVTAHVAAATAELTGTVTESVGAVTQKFEDSTAALSASLEGATSEVAASLDAAEGALTAKAEEASAEIQALRGVLNEGPAQVLEAASGTKAEIEAALDD